MARLELYTSEKYSIEIPDELYQRYKNGEIEEYQVLEECGDVIWDCNQYADITEIKIIENHGNS